MLYAIVRALEHWNNYFKPKTFVLHSYQKAIFTILKGYIKKTVSVQFSAIVLEG